MVCHLELVHSYHFVVSRASIYDNYGRRVGWWMFYCQLSNGACCLTANTNQKLGSWVLHFAICKNSNLLHSDIENVSLGARPTFGTLKSIVIF